MARKEVVSRKIPLTTVSVMCVDGERGEIITREVKVKGVPRNERIFTKRVARMVEDDVLKFVKILDCKTEVKKAFIPMDKFLEICEWE